VPADEVVHVKLNVDRTAKRGYPTLIPVRKNLQRADKLLRNMSTLAQVQATFALIRKHKQYGASAVAAWQQGQADAALNDPVSGRPRFLQRYLPGTILDVPENTDYEFPAAHVPAESYVAVLQAELRAVAARLVLPEYMLSSDASNANYASTLVAEAPAVKNFERLQRHFARAFGDGRYGGPGRCGALWRVVEQAVAWGGLPRAVLERVALQVEAPSAVARDKGRETSRAEALNRAGVLSRSTWAKWEGLDPARERSQIERERQQARPPGGRDSFAEQVTGVLEACLPHKSGRYKGTAIGYDPDKHNANCRLTGPGRGDEVDRFTRELADQLRQDRDVADQIADPRALLQTLTPEQRELLYRQYREDGERWAEEAANQAALQRQLAEDPELARALEETVAGLRAEWEKATPGLTAEQRRRAAPWLYGKDSRYFAPTLTPGPGGRPEFAFVPTPALRRLQLMQALAVGTEVGGIADEASYRYRRRAGFRPPGTDAEALAWYQLVGATRPLKLADVHVGAGGLVSSNSDLQILVPAGALRQAATSVGGYLARVAGGVAANAALAAAAETVAEKYGPAAGAAVPFVPTLLGILGRRAVSGAAFRRFARRASEPKKVHFPGGQVVFGMGPKTISFHTWEVHLDGPLQAQAKAVVAKAAKIAGVDMRRIRVGYSPNAGTAVYEKMSDGKFALVLNPKVLGHKEEATQLLVTLHELIHHQDIERFGEAAMRRLAGNAQYEIDIEKRALQLLQGFYGRQLPEETLKVHTEVMRILNKPGA
jgi:hypothetical protein